MDKITIYNRCFTVSWSWDVISNEMSRYLSDKYNWKTVYIKQPITYSPDSVILNQSAINISDLRDFKNVICRLGSNREIDMDNSGYGRDFEQVKSKMAKCFAVVATNKKLYEVAKQVHNRVLLIPNGLDLDEWVIIEKCPKKFTAGFAANINTTFFRDYKGYDFVEGACKTLNIPLKTALYKTNQIPHNEMREKFYSKISVLVHPTKGEGCIPEEQLLFVNGRLKKAKDVKVGDFLWGGKVKKVYYNGTSDKWYRFSTSRLPYFETTAEHPIKVANWKWRWSINGKKTTKREFTNFIWKKAEEVSKGDYLVVPKYKTEIKDQKIILREFQDINISQHSKTVFSLDEEFAYFLGWYVAEGSICDETQIHLSLGKNEKQYILELQKIIENKIGRQVNYRERNATIELRFRHAPLAEWLKEQVGKDVFEKRIPEVILRAEKNIVRKFIEGYLYGDGYKEKNKNTWLVQNASMELSYQLVLLLSKIDILPSFYTYKRQNLIGYINGREVTLNPEVYYLRFTLENGVKQRYFQDDNNFYVRITDIDVIEKNGGRINFETETSEFNVLYFNTHNCSNVIMEALACGVPVITTKEAGFHGEMLEDGVNVLFCERSTESVEKCIRLLMQDKKLRHKLKINGRKFAEQYHNIKEIAKQYDNLFLECYKANNKPQEDKVEKNVTVRTLKTIYLEGIGIKHTGDIFDMAEPEAIALAGFVDIISEKAIEQPVKDKMIRNAKKKKGVK